MCSPKSAESRRWLTAALGRALAALGCDDDATPTDAAPPCTHGQTECDGDRLMRCEQGVWGLKEDCAATGKTCQPILGGIPRCENAGTADAGLPIVPELDPMSEAEVASLAARGRRLTVASAMDPEPKPVAWAMVNDSCQNRAVALQFALATAREPGAPERPLLDSTATEDLQVLSRRHQRAFASLNVTGPLVTRQTLILPDGTEVASHSPMYYWSHHHAVVLNVEGGVRVLDLSLGDTTVPLDDWFAGFVAPPVECHLMAEAEWDTVWRYWLDAFGNLVPEGRPERLCGYTVSPIFTLAGEQPPQYDFVLQSADAMRMQAEALRNTLGAAGDALTDDQLADVVSRYESLPESAVCELQHFTYCDLQ